MVREKELEGALEAEKYLDIAGHSSAATGS
jgi:hypothetical protein